MKIVALSRKSEVFSTQRFREAAVARSHEFKTLDPHDFQAALGPTSEPSVFFKGQPFSGVDAVLPRFGPTVGDYGLAIVRQMEQCGLRVINSSRSLELARDKLVSFQHLKLAGIPLPLSLLVRTSEDFRQLARLLPGDRYVLKLPRGAQGIGVMLAESRAAVESILDTMWGLQSTVLVQEFLEESVGKDRRIFILGDRVLGAIERCAPPGEFRSNLHRGGRAQPVRLATEEENLALETARVLGLEIAGIDLAKSDSGPVVLEANASPGFEGIESAVGIDIAGRVIEYVAARASSKDGRS